MTGLKTGRNVRKINQFKRLVTTTGLNKNKEFNNHLISLVKKNRGRGTITTLFKTFYFTVNKIQDREENPRQRYDKYYIHNEYYGFGTTFKIRNNVLSFCNK